jgi:hypothetical protein
MLIGRPFGDVNITCAVDNRYGASTSAREFQLYVQSAIAQPLATANLVRTVYIRLKIPLHDFST